VTGTTTSIQYNVLKTHQWRTRQCRHDTPVTLCTATLGIVSMLIVQAIEWGHTTASSTLLTAGVVDGAV